MKSEMKHTAPKDSDKRIQKSHSYPLLTDELAEQRKQLEENECLCKHTLRGYDCISNCMIKGFLRTFAVAYGFKAGLSCALALIRGRLFKKGVIRGILSGDDALRFAQFLGGMSGLYKAIICILRKLRKRNSPFHSAIAAFIAGHAIMLDDPSRRGTIAIYIVVRAIGDAIRLLVHYKKIRNVEHMPVYLFAICQVPLMVSCYHYPHCLDPGYYKWMLRIGKFGSDEILKNTYRSQIEGPYRTENEPFVPCQDYLHPQNDSCLRENILDFVHALPRTARVYIPVHFLPTILFRPRKLMENPLQYLRIAASNTLWSSVFLAGYNTILKYTNCFFRNKLLADPWWVSALGGLLTGPMLLFEHPKRHTELLLYVLPRSLTAIYRMFPERTEILRQIPNGSTLLFCSGMSIFMVCYDMDHRAMRSLNQSALRLVYGSVSKS